MAKVFVHLKSPDPQDHRWENSGHEFLRLPCVGEYIDPGDDQWYQVKAVVHGLDPENQYAAEVYAVAVDGLAEMNRLFWENPQAPPNG